MEVASRPRTVFLVHAPASSQTEHRPSTCLVLLCAHCSASLPATSRRSDRAADTVPPSNKPQAILRLQQRPLEGCEDCGRATDRIPVDTQRHAPGYEQEDTIVIWRRCYRCNTTPALAELESVWDAAVPPHTGVSLAHLWLQSDQITGPSSHLPTEHSLQASCHSITLVLCRVSAGTAGCLAWLTSDGQSTALALLTLHS